MKRHAGRMVAKFLARMSTFTLSFFSVITSSCDRAPMAYGVPPHISVEGRVESSGEGIPIPGIQMNMLKSDSSEVISSDISLSPTGRYFLYADCEIFASPDSVIITATDIDGAENGSYLPSDTMIVVEPDSEYFSYEVDFELLPDESQK